MEDAMVTGERTDVILFATGLGALLILGLILARTTSPLPAPAAPPVPDVVRLTCLGHDEELLEGTTVDVQPDGVHLEITQAHAGPPSDVRLASWQGATRVLGDGRPGIERLTISDPYLPPGNWLIGCFDPARRRARNAPRNYLKLSLVDPTKAWVSTTLSCEHGIEALRPSGDAVDLHGVAPGRMEHALLRRTPGLEPTDAIESAGYPDAELRQFRAVRDGKVIVRFEIDPSTHRALLDGCPSIGRLRR
jgi:hypothetical protein